MNLFSSPPVLEKEPAFCFLNAAVGQVIHRINPPAGKKAISIGIEPNISAAHREKKKALEENRTSFFSKLFNSTSSYGIIIKVKGKPVAKKRSEKSGRPNLTFGVLINQSVN